MKCKIDHELLHDFIEGDLDELSSLIIEEHSKTCEQCKEFIEEILFLNEFLSDVEKEEIFIPEDLKKIKINILLKLKTKKGVLFNIKMLQSKIKLSSEKMNNYINSYPGIKSGKKLTSFITAELLKGASSISKRAVKNSYKSLLKKRFI